jgi:hypothetical protein
MKITEDMLENIKTAKGDKEINEEDLKNKIKTLKRRLEGEDKGFSVKAFIANALNVDFYVSDTRFERSKYSGAILTINEKNPRITVELFPLRKAIDGRWGIAKETIHFRDAFGLYEILGELFEIS